MFQFSFIKKAAVLGVTVLAAASFAACSGGNGAADNTSSFAPSAVSAESEKTQDPAIIGTWVCDTDSVYKFTYTFKDNGKCEWSSLMISPEMSLEEGDAGQTDIHDYYMQDGKLVVDGTKFDYTIEGDTLTLSAQYTNTRIFTKRY